MAALSTTVVGWCTSVSVAVGSASRPRRCSLCQSKLGVVSGTFGTVGRPSNLLYSNKNSLGTLRHVSASNT